MAESELLKWIRETNFQDDWRTAVKSWKECAAFLDDKDPIMAATCRTIGGELEKLAERMLAHLLDDKLARDDQQHQEMEQMILDLFKKATGQ
jgi:hypothetical protein